MLRLTTMPALCVGRFLSLLGVSVAIDRIALSEEGGPVWSALSRRILDSLIGALTRRSQVA